MTHKRNTSGLMKAAEERHKLVLKRANAAITQLKQNGAKINFNTVAKTAKVSIAWLYKERTISKRIRELRGIVYLRDTANSSDRITIDQEALVIKLRKKIKQLQMENRDLRRQLEVVYGELHKLQCGS